MFISHDDYDNDDDDDDDDDNDDNDDNDDDDDDDNNDEDPRDSPRCQSGFKKRLSSNPVLPDDQSVAEDFQFNSISSLL